MCRIPRDQSILDDLRQPLEKHLKVVTRALMKKYDNAFETQAAKILMQRQKPTVTDKASKERPAPVDNVRSDTFSQTSLSTDTAAIEATSDETGSYYSYSSYSSDGHTTSSD
jgi:predicted ATPase with chaperone activity